MVRFMMILAIALACGGCGNRHSPMAPIMPEEKPSTTHAYMYGRFAVHAAEMPDDMASTSADMSFAFVIACNDGSEHKILFSSGRPMIFKMAPSTCTLRGVQYVEDGKEAYGHYVGGFMTDADFAPGRAYYLGDFVMGTKADVGWAMESAYDTYEQTTHDMRRLYPSFANVPTEKRLLEEKLGPPPPPDPAALGEQERNDRCHKVSTVCHRACDQTDDRTTCLVQCGKKAADCRKGP
jgi:hypothetical protein